jgi:hypothetical protein
MRPIENYNSNMTKTMKDIDRKVMHITGLHENPQQKMTAHDALRITLG